MKQTVLAAAILGLFAVNTQAAIDPAKNPLLQVDFKSYVDKIADDQLLEKLDTQGRGQADMFTVFKKGEGEQRNLVRQLFDFNGDGKIDLATHYQKGKKVRTEYDLDFDGKVDSITEFTPETGEVFKKVQIENGNLIWKYWHKGELRRKEVDRNGDGDPDMWVHFRNGRVVRTEIDVSFDGKNIRLEGDLNKGKSSN